MAASAAAAVLLDLFKDSRTAFVHLLRVAAIAHFDLDQPPFGLLAWPAMGLLFRIDRDVPVEQLMVLRIAIDVVTGTSLSIIN
jgi:hypothetical protein